MSGVASERSIGDDDDETALQVVQKQEGQTAKAKGESTLGHGADSRCLGRPCGAPL